MVAIMRDRIRAVTTASLIAMIGNAVLASLKISIGFLSGSLAVVGDGIDSSTDVVIAIVTLVASRIMSKPSDREHPFGHGRAETIATTVLAFVIFFAGAQLFISTIQHLLDTSTARLPAVGALYVTAFSIVGKLLLAWSQFAIGKKHKSDMLIANGENMRNDVLISSAVLLGLFFTFVLKLPILDPIIALAVSIWIVKTAAGIFINVNTELMDGTTDSGLYQSIFDAVGSVKGAGNPHRARIRKIANMYDVDLDIEVASNLTVAAAHEIAVAVERAIRQKIDNVFDVMVHVEPEGNEEAGEVYGLSKDKLN
jgi:cation diffusion facilitator family transporter